MNKKQKKEVLEFLRSVSIMSLAVDGKNGPMSSVLLFTVDDDFTFYFVTVKSTRKAKALLENNKVGVSVWEFDKMMVQMEGKTFEIKEEKKKEEILDRLVISLSKIYKGFWPPVLKIGFNNDYIFYKIEPEFIRILSLKDKTIHPPLDFSFINEFKIR